MSGDVQPRKRKEKRKKKEESVDEFSNNFSSEENIHVHKDEGTGGNICAKIVFFFLLGVLLVLVGLILTEYRGSTDLDNPILESRWAPLFDGWIDESSAKHDHGGHGAADDHGNGHDDEHEDEHDDHDDHDEHEDHDDHDEHEDHDEEQSEEHDEEQQSEELEASAEAHSAEEELGADSTGGSEQKDDDDDDDDDDGDDDDDDDDEGDDNDTNGSEEEGGEEDTLASEEAGIPGVTESEEGDDQEDGEEDEEKDNGSEGNDNQDDDDDDGDEQENDQSAADLNDGDSGENQSRIVEDDGDDDDDGAGDDDDDDDGAGDGDDDDNDNEEEQNESDIGDGPASAQNEDGDSGADDDDDDNDNDNDNDDDDDNDNDDKNGSEEEPEPVGVALKFGVGVALVIVAHMVLVRKWNTGGAEEARFDSSDTPEEHILRRQTLIPEELGQQSEIENEDPLRNENEANEEVEKKHYKTEIESKDVETVPQFGSTLCEQQAEKTACIKREAEILRNDETAGSENEVVEEEDELVEEEVEEEEEEDVDDEEAGGEEEEEEEEEEGYEDDTFDRIMKKYSHLLPKEDKEEVGAEKYSDKNEAQEEMGLFENGTKVEKENISKNTNVDEGENGSEEDDEYSKSEEEEDEEDDEDRDVEEKANEEEEGKEGKGGEENEVKGDEDEVTKEASVIQVSKDKKASDTGRQKKSGQESTSKAQSQTGGRSRDMDDWQLQNDLNMAEAEFEENPEEALKRFTSITLKHPDSLQALYGRARAFDSIAELKHSNTILDNAIEEYQKLLNFGTVVPDDLYLKVADRCINRMRFKGQYSKAVQIHKSLISRFPNEPSYSNELAVTYLIINRISEAKQLLQETLKRWPDNGFALVHYGFILKTSENNMTGAIEHLQRGIRSREPGTIDGRFFFHLADALMRMGRKDESMKINEMGVKEGLFLSKYQRSLYNVDHLHAQPWWTLDETTYTAHFKMLMNNWKAIQKEGLNALFNTSLKLYKDESENLKDFGQWKQLELFARGRKIVSNCVNAPVTCGLIENFPAARYCKRGQVKFSVMQPGTHVWPHCGPTNCRLRAHLGLVVPSNTFLRVAEETRSWEEGKLLIFDDSFEHEVWHNGSSTRLVLIIDVWHPGLTEEERSTLSAI